MLHQFIQRVAATAPDRPVVVTTDGAVSYADLDARSRAYAAGLSVRGITRFGLRVSDAATALSMLVAASRIGAEPCVYPQALDAGAAEELATTLDHQIVVTDADAARLQLCGEPAAAVAAASPILILTTGTTGRPKGARHDWRRLAASVGARATGDHERWLLAYNLNQFAGLHVVLHAVAGGATIVVPRSSHARDALAAIRAHGVTHVSATPTFWRFLLTHLEGEPDVPALQQVTLGGEAPPQAVLTRLAQVFPQARISHVYASTEDGPSVSVRDGEEGLPVSVLDRDDDASVQLRIVDGELQARSKVGMLGYIGDGASGTDPLADGWRRTGDLVEIRGNRIHFIGRTSEVINVGGVKVHPLAVEAAVATVVGVVLAHAYGRPNALTGQIVAVDIVPADDVDRSALEDAVRAACLALPDAARPRRIRFVDALDVRENKIHRGGE